LFVPPEVAISATAFGAVVWLLPVNVTVGCEVYPLPPEDIDTTEAANPEHEPEDTATSVAEAAAPVPPPPVNPIVGGVELE
jgi:hypothetical protein